MRSSQDRSCPIRAESPSESPTHIQTKRKTKNKKTQRRRPGDESVPGSVHYNDAQTLSVSNRSTQTSSRTRLWSMSVIAISMCHFMSISRFHSASAFQNVPLGSCTTLQSRVIKYLKRHRFDESAGGHGVSCCLRASEIERERRFIRGWLPAFITDRNRRYGF